MQISEEVLLKILNKDTLHRSGIHDVILLLKKIHQYYCDPLTTEKLCPESCQLCSKTIARSVYTAKSTPAGKRDIYRGITSKLRNAREDKIARYKKERFGNVQEEEDSKSFI